MIRAILHCQIAEGGIVKDAAYIAEKMAEAIEKMGASTVVEIVTGSGTNVSNNLIAAINSNRHILAALQGVKKKKKRKKYNYVGSENHPPTLKRKMSHPGTEYR